MYYLSVQADKPWYNYYVIPNVKYLVTVPGIKWLQY